MHYGSRRDLLVNNALWFEKGPTCEQCIMVREGTYLRTMHYGSRRDLLANNTLWFEKGPTCEQGIMVREGTYL